MNVPYRTVNGKTLYADAYCPGSPPDLAPAVLLVAGNEWQGGGRTLLSPFVPDFTGAGFVTAVADYRTCPPAGTDHFPSAPQDIIAALAWLRGIPGVDPNRVGVFGSSGGGEIAGVVAISEPRPRCVVSLSGPMDMRIPPSPATGAVYKNYMGCPMSSCPGNWDNASPITHVDAGFPPTWLASSVGDPIPVAGARAMDSALAAAGVDRKYRELEGSEHGLAYWSEVKDEVLAWLTAHLA